MFVVAVVVIIIGLIITKLSYCYNNYRRSAARLASLLALISSSTGARRAWSDIDS